MPKSRVYGSRTARAVSKSKRSLSASSKSRSNKTRRTMPMSSLKAAHTAYNVGFRGKKFMDHMKRMVR